MTFPNHTASEYWNRISRTGNQARRPIYRLPSESRRTGRAVSAASCGSRERRAAAESPGVERPRVESPRARRTPFRRSRSAPRPPPPRWIFVRPLDLRSLERWPPRGRWLASGEQPHPAVRCGRRAAAPAPASAAWCRFPRPAAARATSAEVSWSSWKQNVSQTCFNVDDV